MIAAFSPVMLNLVLWLMVAFGAGWYHRRVPLERLDREGVVLRLREFEQGGDWYERRFRIKAWKERLPETGARGGGMSKRQLPGRDREALALFAAECRRGERTHWTIAAAGPFFFLWNSNSAAVVIAVANAAGNGPFVAILRYNRARITAMLGRRSSPSPECDLPSLSADA